LPKSEELNDSLKDKLVKLKVDFAIGEVNDAKAKILVNYSDIDVDRLKQVFKLNEEDVPLFLSFSFTVKENVDPFEVGELSGELDNLMSMVKKKIGI